ncbi:MAG: tetratricopeptide repeat protein [Spirochaetota bacterium]
MKKFAAILCIISFLQLNAKNADDIIRIIKEPAKSDSSRNTIRGNNDEARVDKSDRARIQFVQDEETSTEEEPAPQPRQDDYADTGNQSPERPQPAEEQQAAEQQAAEQQAAEQQAARRPSTRGNGQNQQSAMPSPMSTDSVLLESGIALYNSGNYASAIETLRELRTNFPASPLADQANMWIARSHFRQDQTREGLDTLELIPESSGEYPSALYLAGTHYLSLKEYDRARRSFYRASSLFPSHEIADDALLELSKLYKSEGNGEEALKSAVYILKNYADRESADDAFYMMGKIYETDPRLKDIEKARQIFTLFLNRAEKGEAPYANSPLADKVRNDLKYINESYFAAE